MRVTDNMIAGQTVFNMQRSIQRFLELQVGMSTGRRINQPSDDPIGTVRDLDYRSELASIEQYQKNVSQAQSWTNTYDSILSDVKDMVSSAKEIAVAMADGTYDATARDASANEIQSLFDRLVQMGNTELEGRRMFSGFATQTKTFTVSSGGVTYNGDNGAFEFEIEPSSRATVNLNGADVFLKQFGPLGEKADLNVGVTVSTLLADLNGGSGVDMTAGTFNITDKNLGISATIDLTGAVTVGDALAAINNQLAAAGITNLTAQLGPDGNNLFFDTTQNGLVSANTSLARLNNGIGVSLSPGKIRVSNGAGVDVLVDLSGSATLGDVIDKFNTQLAAAGVANVTMGLNAAGTGLQITDSNATPLGLTISESSEVYQTASSLGIAGDVNPTLVGGALEPMVDFEVTDTTGTTAGNLAIAAHFTGDYSAGDIDPRLLTSSLVASLRNGVGLDRKSIMINQGSATATIDFSDPALVTIQDVLDAFNNSGLAITATINADGKGIQITNNDPSRSLTIEDVGTGRTSKDMQIFGSNDTMGMFLVLTNALKHDDQEGTGMLLKNLDDAIQHMLDYRATVGSRAERLDNTSSRLTDMNLNFTKLLSETEDADMTRLVSDLATYENNYRAALQATSSIIQPTLLDFLK
jgi:flagellar hook-associated protein 3